MALTKIKTGSVSDSITLTTPTISGVLTANGGAVFNEASADVDFRVESDGNANMLFVDGGNDAVGIGVVPDTSGSGYTNLQINGYAYNIGHSGGDHYITNNAYHNSGWKYGQTSSAQMVELSSGMIQFKTVNSGSADAAITWVRSMNILDGGGVVVNEDGVDMDFRVESDGNANALFVDGGNNSVGLFAGAGDTVNANLAVGLTGVVVAGNTDGATIGKASTVKLVNSNNYGSTNAGVFLLGGGTGGGVGQISSGLGFFRENSGNWGTQLRFYTHPTATSDIDALNEVMRIDAIGRFFVSGTSISDSNTWSVLNGSQYIKKAGTGVYDVLQFYNDNGICGQIYVNGSSTVYATSSDYRIKENVVPMTGSIDRVKALKPSRFNFIVDADRTVDGFIAHEVQAVVPEAISGSKDAMRDEEYEVTAAVEEVRDEDDNVTTEAAEAVMGTRSVPDMQGIDQSKLVPLLVAALQEAIARIEILEGA